ncbi:MAG: hypothetical protein FWD49_04430 [Firmicutes bacterium]|nr:hypothetical protein [Bacillota bacterium]
MLVNQISVYLENRTGRVADFSRVLFEAGINIKTMSIADTAEYGILRAVTDNNDKAVSILKQNGFNASSTNLVGFEVQDKAGEMFKVLKILENASINISYLYSFTRETDKSAIILLKVSDNEKALTAMAENGVKVFGG